MKKTPLKRKSKSPIVKIQDKLWELCKNIVRKRDGNICVICGKTGLEGSSWHTGHFIPSSTCGAFLRYDLRNLHSSCYNCNINLGGNGAMFYKALVEKYSQEFVDNIFRDKNITIKADVLFYEQKISNYQGLQDWNEDKLFNYTKVYPDNNT